MLCLSFRSFPSYAPLARRGFDSGIEVDYLVESVQQNAADFTIGDTKASKDLTIGGESYSKTTQSNGKAFGVAFIVDDTNDLTTSAVATRLT